jgi:hypothetical protein
MSSVEVRIPHKNWWAHGGRTEATAVWLLHGTAGYLLGPIVFRNCSGASHEDATPRTERCFHGKPQVRTIRVEKYQWPSRWLIEREQAKLIAGNCNQFYSSHNSFVQCVVCAMKFGYLDQKSEWFPHSVLVQTLNKKSRELHTMVPHFRCVLAEQVTV